MEIKYLFVLLFLIPLASAEYFNTEIKIKMDDNILNITTENVDDYFSYNISNISFFEEDSLVIHVWKELSCSSEKLVNLTSTLENLTYQMANCKEIYAKNGELATKLTESCDAEGNKMCYSKLQLYESCSGNLTEKTNNYDTCNTERTEKDTKIGTLTKERDDEKGKKMWWAIFAILLTLVVQYLIKESKKSKNTLTKAAPPVNMPQRDSFRGGQEKDISQKDFFKMNKK